MKEKFNKVLNDISNIVGRKKSFNYKLKNGTFNIYWGIKVNKFMDFKILIIFNKLIELVKLGHTITILIADIHTILDNPTNIIDEQTPIFIDNLYILLNTYKLTEEERSKINIIKGSEFQLESSYLLDMFKLISIHGSIKNYCTEFNLDINSVSFKNVLEPILQSLDEEHLKKITCNEIDCQIGYSYNIKLHSFSKKSMVKLGYNAKTYILYDIPEIFITNPLYFNVQNFISRLYTLDTPTLDYMINNLLDYGMLIDYWSCQQVEEDRKTMYILDNIKKCEIINILISKLNL